MSINRTISAGKSILKAFVLAKSGQTKKAGRIFAELTEDMAIDPIMDGIAKSVQELEAEGDVDDLSMGDDDYEINQMDEDEDGDGDTSVDLDDPAVEAKILAYYRKKRRIEAMDDEDDDEDDEDEDMEEEDYDMDDEDYDDGDTSVDLDDPAVEAKILAYYRKKRRIEAMDDDEDDEDMEEEDYDMDDEDEDDDEIEIPTSVASVLNLEY